MAISRQKERKGQYTGELGKRLRMEIEARTGGRLRVHFDHAGSESEKTVAHLGERSSRSNALSYIDIAVVEEGSDGAACKGLPRVLLLCEIEEEGARPKKIIGNICNILLADGVQISRRHYALEKTWLVIGVRTKKRGKSEDKTKEIIARVQGRMKAGLISRIIGVYADTHPDLMDAVEKEILEAVSSNCNMG